jgi:hypothetical protein
MNRRKNNRHSCNKFKIRHTCSIQLVRGFIWHWYSTNRQEFFLFQIDPKLPNLRILEKLRTEQHLTAAHVARENARRRGSRDSARRGGRSSSSFERLPRRQTHAWLSARADARRRSRPPRLDAVGRRRHSRSVLAGCYPWGGEKHLCGLSLPSSWASWRLFLGGSPIWPKCRSFSVLKGPTSHHASSKP